MDDIEKKKKKNRKNDIQWHPAFVVAIKGTLIDYIDALEYRTEHPLNEKPLRIDFLVIKKRPETVIKKRIAEIFRLENVIEYKRPTASLSINEFHKALARTHLYKALSPKVDIADMTLSFVVTKHPRKLFSRLCNTPGYNVEERHPGIYAVTGAMMPIQIIEIGELSDDENLWLHNLSLNIPEKNARWVSGVDRKYGKQIDTGVYVSAVMSANQDKFNKEDILMLTARTIKIFEEIGWTEQWIKKGRLEGELKGIEKGKLEDARAMFAEGDSFEKIARITKIPLKRLKKELQAQ
jgi:hypothetical protein